MSQIHFPKKKETVGITNYSVESALAESMGCGGTKEAGVDTGEGELRTDAPERAPAAPAPAEAAKLAEALQTSARAALPPLPGVLSRLEPLLALPPGAPLLVPPVLVEIQ